MKLYVIRHGQTEMGKNEIIATEDEPLNKFVKLFIQKNLRFTVRKGGRTVSSGVVFDIVE